MEEIFSAVEEEKHHSNQLFVTVSFLEIYNEQLRDLLDPETVPTAIALQRRSLNEQKSPNALKPPPGSPGKRRPNTPPPPTVMADEPSDRNDKRKKLFVHQHPTKGVFVPNLTEAACGSLSECLSFLNLGLRQRATAQTNMNSQSSRSHSVFTMRLRKRLTTDQQQHRTSSVHLIDLAGSERTKRSGAVGQRMREGQSINTSLSVLGQVISKLSTAKGAGSVSHIPFRQSKLTYLLTDALTGNSHTWMLAAVSPARHDQEETLSTLRFASSVKKIKTIPIRSPTPEPRPAIPEAVINSRSYSSGKWGAPSSEASPKGKLSPGQRRRRRFKIRETVELERSARSETSPTVPAAVELSAQSYLEDSLDDWDAKLRASSKLLKELNMDNIHDIAGRKAREPYILNISDDPSLSGCLVYFLNSTKGAESKHHTTVGCGPDNDIVLSGLGIPDQLCLLIVDSSNAVATVEVERTAPRDTTGRLVVGGRLLDRSGQRHRLRSGERIIFGRAFVFRLVVPGSSPVLRSESMSKSRGMSSRGLVEPVAEEEEIQEVIVESSLADTQTAKMMAEVKVINRILDDMGVTEHRGRFIHTYSDVLTRVQKANDILHELRSSSGISLSLVILADISQMAMSGRMLSDGSLDSTPAAPGMAIQVKRKGDIVDVWSVAKFIARLEEMRSKHYISRMRTAAENMMTTSTSMTDTS
ncbi:hypothetical protein FOZ61_004393 [Perkinsus olseni]|nr:hypothetical protein FOZ61_004393 [Perkinsus olseni]